VLRALRGEKILTTKDTKVSKEDNTISRKAVEICILRLAVFYLATHHGFQKN